MAADIYPTDHLREKLNSRQVSWAEIVEVVNEPEVIYGPDYKGRKNYQKGDLCVVVGRDGGVITVLLRQDKQWTDEDIANRLDQITPDTPIIRCSSTRIHSPHGYTIGSGQLLHKCPGRKAEFA